MLVNCYCGKNDDSSMTMCDDCFVWYHQRCCDLSDEQDHHNTCLKCQDWHSHLQKNLLDIIFKRKTFAELLNGEKSYWAGFDSLSNYMEDCDIALQVPVRIFEHIVIIKAWSVLAEYLRDNLAEEDLIDYHIKEASYLYPSIDT